MSILRAFFARRMYRRGTRDTGVLLLLLAGITVAGSVGAVMSWDGGGWMAWVPSWLGHTIHFLLIGANLAATLAMWSKNGRVIRIVQLRGRQVLKVTPRMSPDDPAIEIAFPRNCNDRTQYFKVEVYGHVIADGSINGDVVAHQSVQCAEINGDVHSQGDVKAGNINACGNIVCSGIYDCYKIQANNIICSGSVNSANLTCGQIIKEIPLELR
jgi:hypothetical protein